MYNYRARHLLTIKDENQIEIYEHDICNSKEALLVIKAKEISDEKSCFYEITQMMDYHISGYDGNTILLGGDDNEHIFVFGIEFIKFSTEDKTMVFISLLGNNMIRP